MSKSSKIAVVTGASKGIGFSVAKGLVEQGVNVILTARDEVRGKEASEKLKAPFFRLDVTDSSSVDSLFDFLNKEYGKLDILVNNAGILLEREEGKTTNLFDVSLDIVRKTMEANVYGPLQLCQKLVPIMKRNNYGRIVNVSSGMGQLADMGDGCVGYRLSKVSLNALTRILSAELLEHNILINSVCPGWVRTDMGGQAADRTTDKGAETIVWLSTISNDGPRGKFFRDKKEIPW